MALARMRNTTSKAVVNTSKATADTLGPEWKAEPRKAATKSGGKAKADGKPAADGPSDGAQKPA